MSKEKQEFQLGDTVYMFGEDYKLFESEIWRIALVKEGYVYETDDCEFYKEDINKWVFRTKTERRLTMEGKSEK